MTSTKSRSHLVAPRNGSLVERASAILSVDGIKLSDRVAALLSECEAGTLTFAEARESIIARARAIAAEKNIKRD
jgi:hypothetical protein